MGFDIGMVGSALGGIMGGQQQAAGTAQTREVTKSLANVNSSTALLQDLWKGYNKLNNTTPQQDVEPAAPMTPSTVQNNAGGKDNNLYDSTITAPAAEVFKNSSKGILPMPSATVDNAGAADGGHIKAKHYAADGGSVGAGKRPATLADVMAYSGLGELPMAADGGSVGVSPNPVNNGVINKDFIGPPRPLAPPTKSQTSNRDYYADVGRQRRAMAMEIQRVAMGVDPQTAAATKQMLEYDNQQTALGYTSGAVTAYGRGDASAAADLMNKYSANAPVDFGDTWSASEDGLLTVTNGDGETNQMGVDQLLDWQIANLATPETYYDSLTKRMEVDMHGIVKDEGTARAYANTQAGNVSLANAAAGGTAARIKDRYGLMSAEEKKLAGIYNINAEGGYLAGIPQPHIDRQYAEAEQILLENPGLPGPTAWVMAGQKIINGGSRGVQ